MAHAAKPEPSSKTPSSSIKSRSSGASTKRSLKDIFEEGSAREHETIDRLSAQRHERTISKQDLKRHKLDQKAMEAQYQREREHEQHEYRMMQMRMAMVQRTPSVMQPPQNVEGFGLLDELNSAALPPVPPYSADGSTAYSI
jgi:hypothetical protein